MFRTYVPHLPCINPTPLLFLKIVTYLIRKMIPKFEKKNPLVSRACRDESIDI